MAQVLYSANSLYIFCFSSKRQKTDKKGGKQKGGKGGKNLSKGKRNKR